MRHFEQEEIAQRYAKFRPQVQGKIIDIVAEHLAWSEPFGRAVDYACGTGHSAAPLRAYANEVIGCDVSAEMLEQARQAYPAITFKQVDNDVLPFPDGSVNLLTVGFAFHWLRASTFLQEAARVLVKDGLLVIYNMVFPGVMKGNETYHDWHHGTYTAKYPTPKRNRKPLKDSLVEGDFDLSLEDIIPLSFPQEMSASELRNYLTTQSNISVGVENGEALADIDTWLDKSLSRYFKKSVEIFEYKGKAAVLRRTR